MRKALTIFVGLMLMMTTSVTAGCAKRTGESYQPLQLESSAMTCPSSGATAHGELAVLIETLEPTIMDLLADSFSSSPSISTDLKRICMTFELAADGDSHAEQLESQDRIVVNIPHVMGGLDEADVFVDPTLASSTLEKTRDVAQTLILFDLLAWTVLHEVGHHHLGHLRDDLASGGAEGDLTAERDADVWAAEQMKSVGWSPSNVVRFFESRNDEHDDGVRRTHAPDRERARAIRGAIPDLDRLKPAYDTIYYVGVVPLESRPNYGAPPEREVKNLEAHLIVDPSEGPNGRDREGTVVAIFDGAFGLKEQIYPCASVRISDGPLTVYCNLADEVILEFEISGVGRAVADLSVVMRLADGSGEMQVRDLAIFQAGLIHYRFPAFVGSLGEFMEEKDRGGLIEQFESAGATKGAAHQAVDKLLEMNRIVHGLFVRFSKGELTLAEVSPRTRMIRTEREAEIQDIVGMDVWEEFLQLDRKRASDAMRELESSAFAPFIPKKLFGDIDEITGDKR